MAGRGEHHLHHCLLLLLLLEHHLLHLMLEYHGLAGPSRDALFKIYE
jgi:hypothetical protein